MRIEDQGPFTVPLVAGCWLLVASRMKQNHQQQEGAHSGAKSSARAEVTPCWISHAILRRHCQPRASLPEVVARVGRGAQFTDFYRAATSLTGWHFGSPCALGVFLL
jgi:hypothetical protein